MTSVLKEEENKENSQFIFDWISTGKFYCDFFSVNGNFFIPEECFKDWQLRKMTKVRSDDTWIITFPKSGTTWMQEIVYLVVHDCDTVKAKSQNIDIRCPTINRWFIQDIEKFESPRIITTHLPMDLLPDNLDKKCKIIYVVRNPKDVVVSFFCYAQMLKTYFGYKNDNFEEFARLFLDGKVPWGPWWKHVEMFANNPNIHVVHYEELIKNIKGYRGFRDPILYFKNPYEEIKAIAAYLGKDLTKSQLDTIVSWSSFKNMKHNPMANYEWWIGTGEAKEGLEFCRKGEIGDWQNYFSIELSKAFEDMVEKKLTGYKRSFDYGITHKEFVKWKSRENNIII